MAKLAAVTMPHGGGQKLWWVRGQRATGRARSLKKRRARTSRRWQAGGHYMMEQADSGFLTWQVHAAPQYCRKVW